MVFQLITKDNLEEYFHLWNGKYKRLTRKFESDLPRFSSHTEARAWFKELFGDDFMISDTDTIDGEKMWFYTLLVNRPEWEKGMSGLKTQGYSSGIDFLMSSHSIEIFDSGRIHVVY